MPELRLSLFDRLNRLSNPETYETEMDIKEDIGWQANRIKGKADDDPWGLQWAENMITMGG